MRSVNEKQLRAMISAVSYKTSDISVIHQQEPRFLTDFIVQDNMANSHEGRQSNLQRIMGKSCHVTA